MYLTDKKNDYTRELHDHDDLEVLLESFSKQVEEIVNEAENIEVDTNMSSDQLIHHIKFFRAMYNPRRRLWNSF
jgi:magnesium transporter